MPDTMTADADSQPTAISDVERAQVRFLLDTSPDLSTGPSYTGDPDQHSSWYSTIPITVGDEALVAVAWSYTRPDDGVRARAVELWDIPETGTMYHQVHLADDASQLNYLAYLLRAEAKTATQTTPAAVTSDGTGT